jgi:DNA modification methylase
MKQLALFYNPQEDSVSCATAKAKYGTFQDSKSAPIHRWFQYPAGFSYRAVEEIIHQDNLRPGKVLYDPFMGTGTTLVAAKLKGIESYGVEAHPFVFEVAATKLFWAYDYNELNAKIKEVLKETKEKIQRSNLSRVDLSEYPELIRKCFSDDNLARLHLIKSIVVSQKEPYLSFLKVALTCALRIASGAATGWPYIAPKKKIQEVDGLVAFQRILDMMYGDLYECAHQPQIAEAHPLKGDSRNTKGLIEDKVFDSVFTSPPYLNNYDYADRTRFETYFWGFAKTWGEITEKVRTKLIISATTQINRNEFNGTPVSDSIKEADKSVYTDLADKVVNLSRIRLTKGGKKDYDLMVAGYFNDMFQVLQDVYRTMKKKAKFHLVLGDSAPYGVYIPIYDYIGKLGLGIGFSKYDVEMLRTRGGKWKNNPQRHSVELSEGILTFTK